MVRQEDSSIRETKSRDTVQIHLPNGRVLEGPRGSQLGNFFAHEDSSQAPIVGGVVNGELRELTYPIEMDSKIRPIDMASVDGMRFYRRSLTFLLAATFEELFPDADLIIDHSIAYGGYYGGPNIIDEHNSKSGARRDRPKSCEIGDFQSPAGD